MQQTIKPEASSRLARHLRAGLLTTDDPRKNQAGPWRPEREHLWRCMLERRALTRLS